MSDVAEILTNLHTVRDRVAAACRAVDRDPAHVRLLPVSKTHGIDKILAVHQAGEPVFGENRIQEAEAKAADLADTDIRWAIIGHLQTNKAKNLARFAHEFHALDSLRVAEALDRRLQNEGRQLDVMIQVNSSGEPQKFGLAPEEVEQFATQLTPFSSLNVTGLMTLAVFSPDPAVVGPCFRRMADLQDRLRNNDQAAGSYDELSMGMSGDFELAIAHGATCVRLGEAIFGARLDPNAYWDSRNR